MSDAAAPLDDLFAKSSSSAQSSIAWSQQARPLKGLSDWLRGTLLIYLACEALSMLVGAYVLWSFAQIKNGAEWSDRQYETFDLVSALGEGALGLVGIAVGLVAIVVFCRFVYRAMKNLHLSNARGELMGPGWAVGYNFIPLMNWWKPHQAMRQIWRSSHDPVRASRDPPSTMWGWWLPWIFSNWISNVSLRLSIQAGIFQEEITDFELYELTYWLDMAASALMIVSILFLLPIVRAIQQAQDALSRAAQFDE